jgi:hypothetical protein
MRKRKKTGRAPGRGRFNGREKNLREKKGKKNKQKRSIGNQLTSDFDARR